tara:strand:+ start:92 stop:220 length:129 start_codon:yes stop_codon:yes gene_type:complete
LEKRTRKRTFKETEKTEKVVKAVIAVFRMILVEEIGFSEIQT